MTGTAAGEARILSVVQHPVDGTVTGTVQLCDVYDLHEVDLARYRGILITGMCDQRHLATHRERLSDWVRAGGRMFINGHPHAPFVDGLPSFRKMEFHTPQDLALTALEAHPIWADIDRRDLMYSTGVPGTHSYEELTRIGVAGFYARAYLVGLPEATRAITGIGPGKLPVDLSYPLGDGEIIMHLGNDATGNSSRATPRARLSLQAMEYLEGR